MPTPCPDSVSRLRQFVQEFLEANYTPLEPDTDLTLATWLNQTHYPLWRKKQLVDLANSKQNYLEHLDLFDVKQFVKRETYPESKYHRMINSRADAFKCVYGPLAKALEKEIYKHPAFIKKVPVSERPHYIMENVYRPDAKEYYASDYTSFEANFTPQLMAAVENQMIEYMTSRLPDQAKWAWIGKHVIAGTNKCSNGLGFTTYVRGTRMSGEMTTSLSNGFSNLMFALFVFKEKGITDVKCVIEGDDGLFSIPPNSEVPTAEDFARLGLKIKLETHKEINTASFCGLIFDPIELTNTADPIQVISEINYCDSRLENARTTKQLAGLKSKALSAKYQYNGCPIIDAYCSWILRKVAHIDSRSFDSNDWWTREIMRQAVDGSWKTPTEPQHRTRQLVADKFGITAAEQIEMERFFNSQEELAPWHHPVYSAHCPTQHWENYPLHCPEILLERDSTVSADGLPLPNCPLLVRESKKKVPKSLRRFFDTPTTVYAGGAFKTG